MTGDPQERSNFPAGAINLASARLGARKVSVTDEFFAAVKRLLSESERWKPVLEKQILTADHIHEFTHDVIKQISPVTHVTFNIFLNGGVSRLRLFGRKA